MSAPTESGAAVSEAPVKRGLPPMHPGELLREIVLPALPQSKVELAQMLGVGRRSLYELIDGQTAVTPAMALRLGKLLGNGPELWLNLQQSYDLHELRQLMADQLAQIPTLRGAGDLDLPDPVAIAEAAATPQLEALRRDVDQVAARARSELKALEAMLDALRESLARAAAGEV